MDQRRRPAGCWNRRRRPPARRGPRDYTLPRQARQRRSETALQFTCTAPPPGQQRWPWTRCRRPARNGSSLMGRASAQRLRLGDTGPNPTSRTRDPARDRQNRPGARDRNDTRRRSRRLGRAWRIPSDDRRRYIPPGGAATNCNGTAAARSKRQVRPALRMRPARAKRCLSRDRRAPPWS